MTDDLREGEPLRLTGGVETSAQVATGHDPATGEVVVIVRMGRHIAALTPEGAATLGDALIVESAYARVARDTPEARA